MKTVPSSYSVAPAANDGDTSNLGSVLCFTKSRWILLIKAKSKPQKGITQNKDCAAESLSAFQTTKLTVTFSDLVSKCVVMQKNEEGKTEGQEK